jgi:hypothetical protein
MPAARRDLQVVLLDLCLQLPKSTLGIARAAPNRFGNARTRIGVLLASDLVRGGATLPLEVVCGVTQKIMIRYH